MANPLLLLPSLPESLEKVEEKKMQRRRNSKKRNRKENKCKRTILKLELLWFFTGKHTSLLSIGIIIRIHQNLISILVKNSVTPE